MSQPNVRSATAHIKRHGILLVFPIHNKPEPPSLWSCFYPRIPMVWEWTDDADDRVPLIWHLRERLSKAPGVVYTKWFRGRATLFAADVFSALLTSVARLPDPLTGLSNEARTLYEVLSDDSPLPTKQLRSYADFSGRENERFFTRGMKELWSRLLIVGCGEIEEGGFPSLAVGATKLIYEDLWDEAARRDSEEAMQFVESRLAEKSVFLKQCRALASTTSR